MEVVNFILLLQKQFTFLVYCVYKGDITAWIYYCYYNYYYTPGHVLLNLIVWHNSLFGVNKESESAHVEHMLTNTPYV